MLHAARDTSRYPSFMVLDGPANCKPMGIERESNHLRAIIRGIKGKKTIDLSDLSDDILRNIYRYHVASGERGVHLARFVHKRLAAIGLPFVLRTMSVSSPEAWNRLISDGGSPVYKLELSRLVQYFEVAFIPRDGLRLQIEDHVLLFFPELDTLRFKFTLGVPIHLGINLQKSLVEDFLSRAMEWAPNNSLALFLSQLRPKKFEWLPPDSRSLHVLTLCPMLRAMFSSWSSLSLVYLNGILLLDQPNLTTWTFALLAERVHVRGRLAEIDAFILDGLRRMADSRKCSLLAFEESSRGGENLVGRVDKGVPVLTYGNTLVTLINWTPSQRKAFKVAFNHPELSPSFPTPGQKPVTIHTLLEDCLLKYFVSPPFQGFVMWLTVLPLFILLFAHHNYQHTFIDGTLSDRDHPFNDHLHLPWYPERSFMVHPT
ncbi:hypothetical protein CPC08DRAFT_754441 [Agrocybe pediades]|nr:hypothetical protein CPC08DRAFT_754441 [Agrocybe pediades]